MIVGGLAAAGLAALAFLVFVLPGLQAGAQPSASTRTGASGNLGPPDATPLTNPPAEPAGDGPRATIETGLGNIVIELYNLSSPVATENFVNLAEAGYYDGVVFHRIVPDFVIQGGDPDGTGRGGPGYTIVDEPVVGEYVRGTVAMARNSQPNSQGSQFFIVLDDNVRNILDKAGGYAIFGRVVEGMPVADQIVSGQRTGPNQDVAVNPVPMTRVTIQQP